MFNFLTYNKFKTAKWNALNASQRLKVMCKMEKIMARKQKRKHYIISTRKFNDSTLGLCDYATRTITLNEKYFLIPNLQFLAIATLLHEERHIQQREIIISKKKLFKLSKAYKWQKELQSYTKYDGTDKYSYYSMQEVERDANKFAIKVLKKLYFKIKFRKDENYIDAVKSREEDFAATKEQAKEELGRFYKLKLFARRTFKDKY